jgi:hypothetical protein
MLYKPPKSDCDVIVPLAKTPGKMASVNMNDISTKTSAKRFLRLAETLFIDDNANAPMVGTKTIAKIIH